MEDPVKTPDATPEAEDPKAVLLPDPNVTLAITDNGETKEESIRFHTPTLARRIAELPETATVKITAAMPEGQEPKVLLEGTKAETAQKLAASIVPPAAIVPEIRKFMRFLLDHSDLRAVGVHAVYLNADGTDAGFGFAETAPDCTIPQAVSFVSCGDANINEFVTKAKIDVPGRTPAACTVVAPTPEEVKSLG